MARRGANGRVFQAAFQSVELLDRPVEFGRLVRQQNAVDLCRWTATEHRADLVE